MDLTKILEKMVTNILCAYPFFFTLHLCHFFLNLFIILFYSWCNHRETMAASGENMVRAAAVGGGLN